MRNPVRRNGPHSGWTFVEAIIVITIVILLTGTVAVSAARYVERARIAAARSLVESTKLALFAYFLDTGSYPTEGQGLDALWSKPTLAPVPSAWAGPYVERPVGRDPWGNELVYRRPGEAGLPYSLVSLGSDGMPGGEGSAADIGSATR